MSKNSRSRASNSRKRFNIFRENSLKKNIVIFGISISSLIVITILILNINFDRTSIAPQNNILVLKDEKNNVDIYNEDNKEQQKSNEVTPINEDISITVLGELMMGGVISNNLDYLYNTPFKTIGSLTRTSDFTISTLSTNITNFDKVNDVKTKYLVTKDITSAIMTLGIDSLSIANDHVIDYAIDIFNNTKRVLKENETYVSGINDNILYLQKGNKKISVISANNVIIGTKNNYLDYGINIYSKEKMNNDIKIAKENSDFVIVDMHWGRENIYGVTTEMNTIARNAIDSRSKFDNRNTCTWYISYC